ncbi:MAG TPA: gliding motility-associated C-terminal domain-containing protein [Bacteroidales bacterium]|nr:gliding motility-associated C-terminal domain-containing protein [Bacteroidales bacterium]HPS16469.1 gliding motility-associated C-terminal domain-containing protein [Bacteroidales bacterium]
MKKVLIILLFFLYTVKGITQNLVPNPSFEEYSICPSSLGQLSFSIPWQNPNNRTPDFCNSCCSISTGSSVPDNSWGNENAHTGIGYSGICSFYKSELGREYVQVLLIDSLKNNTIYCVEFYVSLGDKSDYAVNNLGAFLSTMAINSTNDLIICIPQIINISTNPLTNKDGWKKISGSFVASGGEKYITIGNFNDDPFSDTIHVDSSGYCGGMTYYYIDDVCVYDCSAPVYIAEAGNNTTICKGDSVQIGSTPHAQYLYNWQPSIGLSDTTIANPYAKPEITTKYYLTQKDFKFDETIDSITVFVKDCNDSITIPNAFTPNGDSYNDYFIVHGKNIKTISGKIFNRWGQELYKFTDANSNPIAIGWNGKTEQGNEVSEGTYFYIITVTFENGEVQEKHGCIELLR